MNASAFCRSSAPALARCARRSGHVQSLFALMRRTHLNRRASSRWMTAMARPAHWAAPGGEWLKQLEDDLMPGRLNNPGLPASGPASSQATATSFPWGAPTTHLFLCLQAVDRPGAWHAAVACSALQRVGRVAGGHPSSTGGTRTDRRAAGLQPGCDRGGLVPGPHSGWWRAGAAAAAPAALFGAHCRLPATGCLVCGSAAPRPPHAAQLARARCCRRAGA